MHYSARNMFNKVTHMWHYVNDRKHNMYGANSLTIFIKTLIIIHTKNIYLTSIFKSHKIVHNTI